MRGRALLSCRTPWLMSLERVALSAVVQVFETGHLAFDTEELMQLHGMDRDRAERWMQLTEGWPVLCGPRLPVDIDPLSHPGAEITRILAENLADYFEHELLSSLSGSDAALLMRASIFDAVMPGMLEAIGCGESWARLISMKEAGIPTSIARCTPDRVVLHPIFRDFLEHRLRVRSPAMHHSLHRRAAMSYATVGDYRVALRHATRTGDSTLVTQITESSGGWRMSFREGLQALDGGACDHASSSEFPKAFLARCYWLTQTGRLEEASRLLRSVPSDAGIEADVDTVTTVLEVVYRDVPYAPSQVDRLVAHSQTFSGDAFALGPSSATVAAAILNNAGMYERAVSLTRAAILDSTVHSNRYVQFYGSWHCANALHGLGRVTEAGGEYAISAELAEEVMGDASNECRLVGLGAAHVAYLGGQDERAAHLAGDITGLYRLHAWFEPYSRALEVATALSRQRADRMLEEHVLQSFSELSERRTLPRLAIMVAIGRARQELASGDLARAAHHAEAACRQVIDTLPADAPGTWRVLAPALLERARIALAAGDFKLADDQLGRLREARPDLQDGAVCMEAQLLEAYLALHGRQYDHAALQLSHAVSQAQRHGLVRPFLENAGRVGELVEFVRTRVARFDPTLLQRALELSALDRTAAPAVARRPGDGRLLLTEREMDILGCLSDGLSSKEMARRLRIGEGTIKTHRKHLYEKLNVGLRSHAITKARELGLL